MLVFDVLRIVGKLALYYHLFLWIHLRVQPANVDPTAPSDRKKFRDLPLHVVSLFHAIITTLNGYAYLGGVLDLDQLLECRMFSTAYLFFDMAQSFASWHRDAISNRTGLHGVAHPYGVVFHHVMTVLLMYGWLFDGSVAGACTFFVSETPVIFLNATWLYVYMDRIHSRECAVCSNLTVITYFLCRIVLFPLVFLFIILPNLGFSLFNPVGILILLLLALVYLFNVVWFAKLVQKNIPFMPSWITSLPVFTLIPQYTCCGQPNPMARSRSGISEM